MKSVDQPRHHSSFTSPNGRYELKMISPLYTRPFVWGLVDKETKQTLYQLTGDYGSRTVFICDEGTHLAIVADFSEREPAADLDVLLFFEKGVLLKKYELRGLLKDPSNVTRSVSHFFWLPLGAKPLFKDEKLSITTTDKVSYEFDLKTGEIIAKV